MQTWAVIRYDHDEARFDASGVFTSPGAAKDMADEWGSFSGDWPDGAPDWQEPGEEAMVTCDWLASTSQATFYVTAVPLTAEGSWRSAANVLYLLREVLLDIARNGSRG